MSEQGLQERCAHTSPSYTFHPYGLPFARFTDLYCAEKGLMTRSMNMLLLGKIYSPAPCVYKNYHKIVMYPPDWKILLSRIIFPVESFMLLFSALLTQQAHSLMYKDNILSVFILISFFLIFHFLLCYFNEFITCPKRTSFLCFVHTSGVMKLFRLLISALLEIHGEK